MTFTISQQPDDINLILYPNGDIAVNLSTSSGATHYVLVDDVWYNPDDDTSYVYSTATTVVSDKYSLQDHGSETGTINYVRLISRAKSDTYEQSSSGTYQLFIDDGTTIGYSSNFAPLPTSYVKKYYTWATKPSGGAWSWTDIDNVYIGVRCSSPTVTEDYNLVLRPSGNGDLSECSVYGDTTNYLCVDEETADDDTTYVYVTNVLRENAKTDLYSIPTTNVTGDINYVRVYVKYKCDPDDEKGMWIIIKTRGTIYTSEIFGFQAWHTNYKTWTSNPSTGAAWTWDEINNLQIGVKLSAGDGYTTKATQVYAIVNYTTPYNPEIRTTQEYAVVNYSPPQNSVTLNDPESIEITHSRRIKRFLFGSGDYEVSDFGRSGKTLNLSGIETTNAETKMNALKTMTHYGKYVTITGLPDSNLDGDYYITSFNWEKREGYTDRINWSLTLEEA